MEQGFENAVSYPPLKPLKPMECLQRRSGIGGELGAFQYRSNKCNDVEKGLFDMRSLVMLRLLACILGAGALDDACIEAQATRRQQFGAQLLQEFAQQRRMLAGRRDGNTPGALLLPTPPTHQTHASPPPLTLP